MFTRVLVRWASDVLLLRKAGRLDPCWRLDESLAEFDDPDSLAA